MSEDADYVCTLDEATIKKAKDELNENPQDRLAAVKALRDWIKDQSHIKCPELDTLTLLRFLRGAKFSQIRARELFEGNLSLKSRSPDVFLDIDSHDKKMLDFIKLGYVAPLPKRTPNGCQILLYRMGKLDIKKFELKQIFRVASVIVHYISMSEMTQVNGTVFLMDFTDIGPKFLTKMMTSEMSKWQSQWQKNTPGRFKGFYYYNCGLVFDAMMAFAKPLFPKKWIDRIKTHDTMESVYRDIPMSCLPVEYLPDDYTGPNVGPIDDIIQNFLTEIQQKSFRDQLLEFTSHAYSVDQSKRPEAVTSHFRKLNVD